jgi:hypothetical protein
MQQIGEVYTAGSQVAVEQMERAYTVRLTHDVLSSLHCNRPCMHLPSFVLQDSTFNCCFAYIFDTANPVQLLHILCETVINHQCN